MQVYCLTSKKCVNIIIEATGLSETVSFELDRRTWTGIYDNLNEMYNIVTATEKGSVYVVSAENNRDEKLFESVLSSIKVTP